MSRDPWRAYMESNEGGDADTPALVSLVKASKRIAGIYLVVAAGLVICMVSFGLLALVAVAGGDVGGTAVAYLAIAGIILTMPAVPLLILAGRRVGGSVLQTDRPSILSMFTGQALESAAVALGWDTRIKFVQISALVVFTFGLILMIVASLT